MARLTPERAASSFKVMPACVLRIFNRRPIALSSFCWSIVSDPNIARHTDRIRRAGED
jgi:hypothetical protein